MTLYILIAWVVCGAIAIYLSHKPIKQAMMNQALTYQQYQTAVVLLIGMNLLLGPLALIMSIRIWLKNRGGK